jgi:hypothetical protein
LHFNNFAALENWLTYQMPKYLAGCHYNEEESSRHLKKNIGYWAVQMNGNKFATSQILRKLVEVVKGRILAGGAQKSPEPWMELSQFHEQGEPGLLV